MVRQRLGDFNWRFRRNVLLPGMLILAAAAALTAIGLLKSAKAVDDIATQALAWEPYRAIGRGLDQMALAQETVGICDLCEAKVVGPDPDTAWIDHNIGRKLSYLYRIHEVHVLNEDDRPVYALVKGDLVPPARFSEIAPEILPFASLVRGRTVRPNGFSDRLPGQPISPFNAIRTSPTAIHATELGRVRGQTALISVFRMRAEAPDESSTVRPPLLVAIRYLDAAFLTEATTQNYLVEPRFSADGTTAPGEQAAPLINMAQQNLGYIVHKPMLPGSMLIRQLLPMAIAGVLLVAALLLTLTLKLRSMMRKEQRQMDDLHQAHVELQAREAQTHHLAFHDMLTGLPNRGLFNKDADKILALAKDGRPVALLLLDLDRFKNVNDRFGHLAGDALIQEVAHRLGEIVSHPSKIARLGGDEFAIILHPDDPSGDVKKTLDAILETMRAPFDLVGGQAHVGVSIGVALAPDYGTDRTDLMRKADIAMYRAKAAGRDCYSFFTEAMDETVQMKAALESDLRRALGSLDEFEVVYQPQINARTNEVAGCEALLRWNHPIHGMVMPQIFVPVAEEAGIIGALGDLVLKDACRLAKARPDLSIAVNLSPVQFLEQGFAERLARDVRRMEVDPGQIELEVTEGVLLDDNENVRNAVRSLRESGFRIALDDFGTGYSSLSYLNKFEVDKIKIDRSFVQRLGKCDDANAIVTAVVTLAHAMGLSVTAEGVEEPEQDAFLRQVGVAELQGFLFCNALRASEIEEGIVIAVGNGSDAPDGPDNAKSANRRAAA